jgi:hypothetical protein
VCWQLAIEVNEKPTVNKLRCEKMLVCHRIGSICKAWGRERLRRLRRG